eukprot:746424-Hanusia_phi.AAC.4
MDLWGVGCVFFEIISLYPLFPGLALLEPSWADLRQEPTNWTRSTRSTTFLVRGGESVSSTCSRECRHPPTRDPREVQATCNSHGPSIPLPSLVSPVPCSHSSLSACFHRLTPPLNFG